MKKVLVAMLAVLLTQSAVWAADQDLLAKNDDCYLAVEGLAKGLALSYKVYGYKKPARVISSGLSSATETRDYSVTIEHNFSYDTYQIMLSNDSASKCLLLNMEPVEIGG